MTEAYYRGSVAKGRALLERIVERCVAHGECLSGAATELPIVIMALIWSMTSERLAPIAAETFLAAHLDLALHGMTNA